MDCGRKSINMKDEHKLIFKTLREYKAKIEEHGYKIMFIALRGSQNYNLDDEYSDYDAIAVVLPKMEDFMKRNKIATKMEFENGECIIQDILIFHENIAKGNMSFIEAVQTNYKLGDTKLFKEYLVNPRSMYGMALEKEKALRHPYPSKLKVLEKHGYDPKQLHHIIRLRMCVESILLDVYDNGTLIFQDDIREKLIEVKRGLFRDRDVDSIVKTEIARIKALLNNIDCEVYKKENAIIKPRVDKDIISVLQTHFLNEIIESKDDETLIQHRTFDQEAPKKTY